MLKQKIIDRYLHNLSKEYDLVQYIGIAAGLPIKGKAFFDALRPRLKETEI